MIGGIYGYSAGYGSFVYNNIPVDRISPINKDEQNLSEAEIRSMKRIGKLECKACRERRYQDSSDEMVSFKSPGHISPGASGAAVRAHEQEHVSNAYKDAAKNNGQVIQASVALNRSTCPECGRSYVAGGTTTTQIKYQESNPYSTNQKLADQSILLGMNFDVAV